MLTIKEWGVNKVKQTERQERRESRFYRAKDPSIQFVVLVTWSSSQGSWPSLLVPPARTTASFKGLGRVGVAVCGPDGFTSVYEGGVGEDETPGDDKRLFPLAFLECKGIVIPKPMVWSNQGSHGRHARIYPRRIFKKNVTHILNRWQICGDVIFGSFSFESSPPNLATSLECRGNLYFVLLVIGYGTLAGLFT